MKVVRWLKIAALGLIGLVVAVLLIALATEKLFELRDERLYPPPGQMVDAGNGGRQIFCEGSGSPTVVLITGNGIPAVLIRPLQDQAAKFSRACSYDRAGLGWSKPAVRPLNVLSQADELHTILAAIGERGPFVLAGHSYGGLIARQYVKENPQAVAALRAPIFEEKAVDFLLELAGVTESKVSRDELYKDDDSAA